jgi:alkylhydroperoxidase family enzyme
MSRITKVGRSQTTGTVRAALDRMAEQRGNIPNMFRIVAHRPELLTTMLAHFAEVMKDTTVPVRLKELLAVQTSLANSCTY